MQLLQRAFIAVVAVLASALPASAQDASGAGGPSLIFVWAWILIAGVIIFIVGTSMGVNANKK